MNTKQSKQKTTVPQKQQYQTPAIIYTGQISTRAGSGNPGGSPGEAAVDPADLFGND